MRVVLILLTLFTLLLSDDDGHDKKHHHYYGKDLTFLNLTTSQKDKVKDLIKTYQKEIKEYRAYKDEALIEKQKLFTQNHFDEQKFEQITQNLSLKASKIETTLMSNLHSILDNQQRKMFVTYIDEWEVE